MTPGEERDGGAEPMSSAAPEPGPPYPTGPMDTVPAEPVDTSWLNTELIFHEPPVSFKDDILR